MLRPHIASDRCLHGVVTCDPAATPVDPCANAGYPTTSGYINYTDATPGDVSCEPDIDGVYYYVVDHSASTLLP